WPAPLPDAVIVESRERGEGEAGEDEHSEEDADDLEGREGDGRHSGLQIQRVVSVARNASATAIGGHTTCVAVVMVAAAIATAAGQRRETRVTSGPRGVR